MQYHDAANIFPLDEEHLDELAADIKQRGLFKPIETMNGKILDGRRRWLACAKARVIPSTVEVAPDDPVAYVLSLNLHRRHLTVSQLAMVGDAARELYEKAAKERKRAGGQTAGRGRPQKVVENSRQPIRRNASAEAGKAVGVSEFSIERARTVRTKGIPEIAAAVETGKLPVSRAAQVARLPKPDQPQALAA